MILVGIKNPFALRVRNARDPFFTHTNEMRTCERRSHNRHPVEVDRVRRLARGRRWRDGNELLLITNRRHNGDRGHGRSQTRTRRKNLLGRRRVVGRRLVKNNAPLRITKKNQQNVIARTQVQKYFWKNRP